MMSENLKNASMAIIAGSLVIDISCNYERPTKDHPSSSPEAGSSNRAKISQAPGGVAHNIALAAHYAGASVLLSSVIAKDVAGDSLLKSLTNEGLSSEGILRLESSEDIHTGQYVGNYDANKNFIFGMADVSIMKQSSIESSRFWKSLISIHSPQWVVLDSTFSPSVTEAFLRCAKISRANVILEPVSAPRARSIMSKAEAVIKAGDLYPHNIVDIITPNDIELEALFHGAKDAGVFQSKSYKNTVGKIKPAAGPWGNEYHTQDESLEIRDLEQKALQLVPFIPTIICTLGARGCLLVTLIPTDDPRLTDPDKQPYLSHCTQAKGKERFAGGVYIRHFRPALALDSKDIVSVNGAGDTFLGTVVAGLIKHQGTMVEDLIPIAQEAAMLTLKSAAAVSPEVQTLKDKL